MLGKDKILSFNLKPIEVRPVFETEQVEQAILAKSYKELGMNKSSIWYQKKRLNERGSIRLFNVLEYHFRKA